MSLGEPWYHKENTWDSNTTFKVMNASITPTDFLKPICNPPLSPSPPPPVPRQLIWFLPLQIHLHILEFFVYSCSRCSFGRQELTSFTENLFPDSSIMLCLSGIHSFLLLRVFHGIHLSHFVYPYMYLWTFWLFLVFASEVSSFQLFQIFAYSFGMVFSHSHILGLDVKSLCRHMPSFSLVNAQERNGPQITKLFAKVNEPFSIPTNTV